MPNILIVDDEPVVLDVLKRLLEEEGREIALAGTPEEAMRIAQRSPIDVALIDKNLQGASGLDLSRKLKALQPELEVILITGYASLDTAIEAVQIGAFDYLTKPIDDYAALALKVHNATEKSRLRRGQRVLLERLSDSEARYRHLVASAPDAVVVYEVESGLVQDANGAAVQLYEYTLEELTRLRATQLGPIETGRHEHRRKNGGLFTADVSASGFTLQGKRVRVQSVRDATAAVQAERERRTLEERLRISQKMEAVGRLAGGVAHDFNNLLTIMSAHAEFLSQELGPDNPEVQGISRAADRGAALTKQLLLFSRHKPVAHEQIDLNAAVTDVMRLLARVLGEAVRIESQRDADLWWVCADADQIGQVVINLAVNARDAMPRGGTVRIGTSNELVREPRALRGGELPRGRYATLSVADTGEGMTEEVLARLFEPFFTTKEFGKGTGLGLATVYGIVRACGGAIDVDSRPGAGSTFRIYLPASDEQVPSSKGRATRPPEAGRGETILVVEDEDPVRMLLRRILVDHGYQVLEARDGADGLRRSQEHGGEIHLLLTDVVMPEMTGPELAQRVAAQRPATRVLFMTGYTEHGPTGAEALLHKPFSSATLLGHVRRLLDAGSLKT
jgi:two-component system, cell cycle sensor histidine kinase and response regulator CckA